MHTEDLPLPSHFSGLDHVGSSYRGVFSSIAKIPWVREVADNPVSHILPVFENPKCSQLSVQVIADID